MNVTTYKTKELGIDGMKYYFSWEIIKEQHWYTCLCLWGVGGGGWGVVPKTVSWRFFFISY